MDNKPEVNKPTQAAITKRNTNKRRMAWSSFLVIVLITVKYLFFATDVALIAAISPVISTLIWACASITGAYLGFSFMAGKPKL